jgi:hypothetical protein
MTQKSGFDSRQNKNVFVFFKTFRSATELIKPPTKRLSGSDTSEIIDLDLNLTTQLHLLPGL